MQQVSDFLTRHPPRRGLTEVTGEIAAVKRVYINDLWYNAISSKHGAWRQGAAARARDFC